MKSRLQIFFWLPVAAMFRGAVVLSQGFLVISMFLPLIAMISNMTGN